MEIKYPLIVKTDSDKYNFINSDREFISEQWFDFVYEFKNGVARVELNGKYNLIDADGVFYFHDWADHIGEFYDGFARIAYNGKENFISDKGIILCKDWFEYVNGFENGFAIVKNNSNDPQKLFIMNVIDTNGKLISKLWFDNIHDIDIENKIICVELDGKENIINFNGDILCEVWFEFIDEFIGQTAIVKQKGKYNVINTNGELLSYEWVDSIRRVSDIGVFTITNGKKGPTFHMF